MKQRSRFSTRGFTIVELLVVVSIIALLVGILLPAIGKAREQAQLTRSQSNIRQIGTSIQAYAAEYGDRQPTFINDSISVYGGLAAGGGGAMTNYAAKHGGVGHPWLWLGWAFNDGNQLSWNIRAASPPDLDQTWLYEPINFTGSAGVINFGSFRLPNAQAINRYMNGRFYDEVYYAPKDTAVMNSVEKWLGIANEFIQDGPNHKWSSYCMSPAAMFNPAVFKKTGTATNSPAFTDPWTIPSGFKSPGIAQAKYSNLKTHVIEHHWLQNRRRQCHQSFFGGVYDGCTPYFYNGAAFSVPVSLFYDGHVGGIGAEQAYMDNEQVAGQGTAAGYGTNYGLWSMNTPLGGAYSDCATGGYYMNYAFDCTSTSFHILTIDGIEGRDVTSK